MTNTFPFQPSADSFQCRQPVWGLVVAAALLVTVACGERHEAAPVVSPASGFSQARDFAGEAGRTFADSVALAHGLAAWSQVERFAFDFVVEVADTARVSRSWVWYPGRDSIVRTVDGEALGYLRVGTLDSAALAVDEQFVNDSYWVLMPLYLAWSADGYAASVTRDTVAPISGEPATMLTVAYGAAGGYTPGDAYDLFVDEAYVLREWVFRKGGQAEPSSVMSWDAYREVGPGIRVPTAHGASGRPVRILHGEVSATTGS